MNGDIDPRIDKMMAYLYGELPEAEERAFRRLLEKDDVLRAEYEELSGTREALTGWEVEERVPSFVLVEGAERTSARSATGIARSAGASDGLLVRTREFFRNLGAAPAWGLAVAAVALLVLAATDFRIESVNGGIAFRFGDAPLPGASAPGTELATSPTPGFRVPGGTLAGAGNLATPVGSLSHQDLDQYDAKLMITLARLLNDYDARRDEHINEGFQSFYQQVVAQQTHDYRELSGRIDQVGRELILETDRSRRGFNAIRDNLPTRNNDTPQTLTGTEEDQ